MENAIYERKSCRRYLDEEISSDEFAQIEDFIKKARTLTGGGFSYEILTKDEVSRKNRWSSPYYLAIYAKDRLNVGFIFQQVSLFMHTLNIGSCWNGLDVPKNRHDDFVIVMSFGKSDDFTRNLNEFRRKNKSSFADIDDERLNPAYYAPSAVNAQPWYFRHNPEGYDVYQIRHNVLKRKILGKWNHVDIGIALAHLYVTYPDTFKFKVNDNPENLKGYDYMGSVSF